MKNAMMTLHYYTPITYKNLIVLSSFLWQFSLSYHRAVPPNMPYENCDRYTPESWAEIFKEGWQEFLEYYSSKIEPLAKQVLDETKQLQDEKKSIRIPWGLDYGAYFFCVLFRRQWVYIPVSLAKRCEAGVQAAINQIELLNNTPELVSLTDKFNVRYELTICASILSDYIYGRKARRLIGYIEYFYQPDFKEFLTVQEIVDQVFGGPAVSK